MTIWGEGGLEVRLASTRWALLRLALVGSAVCNLTHTACFEVEHHDPAHALVDPLAIEGYVLPIRRPRRSVVAPACGGVGDLADVASVGVHCEEGALGLIRIEPAAKDDLTVPGRRTARAFVVFVIVSATGEHRQSHG
jgi:hypothetical protein